MLLQSRQKMEFNMLESQNLLTEVLFDPVRTSIIKAGSWNYLMYHTC